MLNAAVIFRAHEEFVSAIGLVVNFILIYLIRTKSPIEMGSFRYLLWINCLIDVVLCVSSILTQMVVLVDGEIYLLVPLGPAQNYGQNIAIASTISFTFLGILSYLTVVVSVLYRYFTICRLDLHFNKLVLIFWLFTVAIIANGIYVCLIYVSVFDGRRDYELNREQYDKVANDVLENHMGHPIYNYFFAKTSNAIFDAVLAYLLVMYNIGYGLIIYFCYRIHRFVKQNMLSSSNAGRLHLQLTRLLISMAIAPVFAILLPCTILFTSAFIQLRLGNAALFISMGFAWLPLMNPMLTIAFVEAYKTPFRKQNCWNPGRNAIIWPTLPMHSNEFATTNGAVSTAYVLT